MDSGNEVIIVEEKVATNGLNGNYEEVTGVDMKTRSKATDGVEDASNVKPKRSTRTAAPKSEDKAGSDNEKKEKKMNLRSGDAEPPKEGKAAEAKSSSVAAKKLVESTPTKKKGEREDDSGINSRSSSVSNEETYSSRMRTRSKTAEALSSSTPASTKKSSRMPLSTYDFEDISFDEYPSTSNSLKRKAVLYVEEMEEPEENASEPPPKRVSISSSFVDVLLNPLRAIRGKISVASQTVESAKGDAASQTHHVTKATDDETEKEHVASQTENTAAEVQAVDKATNTCTVM